MTISAHGSHETPSTAAQRSRELYKYFSPEQFTSKYTVPDTLLTAHSQLVAWRLNCQRAMVSVIDRDDQFFIGEASKTLDLTDSSQSEKPEDALWAGCVSVPKKGRLCEHTIQAMPQIDGAPAYFEVTDLAADPRFKDLQFVKGPPYFKYYCGLPLKTKRGIPIGSLFALDDKVRNPISQTHLTFMATMADNCMAHLEMQREKEELKRVKDMNLCLAAFVDPDNRKKRKRTRATTGRSPSVSTHHSAGSLTQSSVPAHHSGPASKGRRSSETPIPEEGSDADVEKTEKETPERVSVYNSYAPSSQNSPEEDPSSTLRKATGLLFKSLALDSQSGVVFLDTGTSLHDLSTSRDSSEESSEDERNTTGKGSRRTSLGTTTKVSYMSWTGSVNRHGASGNWKQDSAASDVLAATFGSPGTEQLPFTPLSQHDLVKLIKKFPRGMLCTMQLENEGPVYGSSSDERSSKRAYNMPLEKDVIPSTTDMNILSKYFPTARQIIMVPFLDPISSRYTAFFAYNASLYRHFERSPEFLHCISFAHCISTELTRLATLASDQQKSDFIGSISHELRSPLHGILASCEFLEDTTLSSFQKSLVDTADGCARTLLDTINMVLDYSKINAFERSVAKARKSRKKKNMFSTAHLQPALNIYGDVDLAAITEEVVEGVATGQIFKNRVDGADAEPGSDISKSGDKGWGAPDVEIILDIAPKSWTFLTQPGAFRRVVMNVFGNSIKYTHKGSIKVKLESQPALKKDDETELIEVVTLIIEDTGQGISPEYMRTKLFTPFAQESSIAPGTGLGLSLVRSIVRMLSGEIDIQSTLGVGTTVTIKFPMVVGKHSDSAASSSTTPSSAGVERVKDESLRVIRKLAKGKTATYYTPMDSTKMNEGPRLLQQAVNLYLTKWYWFTLKDTFSKRDPVDLVVVSQNDLPSLIGSLTAIVGKGNMPMIAVICATGSINKTDEYQDISRNIESLSYPFGPFKLAKVVRWLLEGLTTPASSGSDQEGTTLPQTARDEMTEVVQAVEEVNLAPDMKVVQQGQMMANEEFAPLMVEAMSSMSTRSIEQASGFPFPPSIEEEPGIVSPSTSMHDQQKTPKGPSRALPTPSSIPLPPTPGPRAQPALSLPTSTSSTSLIRSPRLLLVDDNGVNLRLIRTFMEKKRGYTDIHLASDGSQALSTYNSLIARDPPEPPDIIFMDISMPVMNGFQATRLIREAESSFRANFDPLHTPPTAMIIALTGLASGRDQNEAFTSGFDLYLVKPISFKSVAKLLDSWERNGGAATLGAGGVSIPHGQLTADDVASVGSLGSVSVAAVDADEDYDEDDEDEEDDVDE